MDIGQKNSQDNIILKIALSIGGILGGIYYAKDIIKSNIIIGVIIVIAVIVGILIVYKKDVRFLQIIKKIVYKPVLPLIWNVPHQNSNFAGREIHLKKLKSMLKSGQSNTRKVAICGLGGVGKTQLAIEYCYRNKDKYRTVWWVRSEKQETLASDYADIATEIDLPAKAKGYTDQSVVIKAVKHWLEQNSSWLLIFDDAQSQEDLINYLPSGGAGHVIITSRYPFWGNIAKLLSINVFDRVESIDFLCTRTIQDDKESADTLAEKLGDLPLALERANAYIERTSITLSEYLRLFQFHPDELLKTKPPTDYPQSVATTWSLSMDRVRKDSPVAADLLNLCAFLAKDDISLKLFSKGKRHLPESLASMVTNPFVLNSSIEALRCYSLVDISKDALSYLFSWDEIPGSDEIKLKGFKEFFKQEYDIDWVETAKIKKIDDGNNIIVFTEKNSLSLRLSDGKTKVRLKIDSGITDELNVKMENGELNIYAPEIRLSIHPLLQAVIRDHLKTNDKKIWTETALRIISDAFPIKSDDPESIDMQKWLDCSRLLPHALATSAHAEILEVAPGLTSNILNQSGSYLREISDLHRAKELHEKALKLAEDSYGENHPCVAICLENLGRVLRDLGDLKAAKEHYEKALKIDKDFYDSKHSHIAICEDGLGRVLFARNELAAAKEHLELALKIDEAIRGSNHFKVAIRLNNIGAVLHNQGDLKAAKEHYEKAIKIDVASYGISHPYVAIRLNNIGTVLHDQRDLKAAKEHYEKAIKIDEAFYGLDNIHITTSLNNLGCVLLDMGDLKGAKVNFKRALNILKKVYDPDNPEIARLFCNLGFLLLIGGDINGAKKYYERAMQIYHNSRSKEYPCPVTLKENLELLNSRQASLFYPLIYKIFIIYKKLRK